MNSVSSSVQVEVNHLSSGWTAVCDADPCLFSSTLRFRNNGFSGHCLSREYAGLEWSFSQGSVSLLLQAALVLTDPGIFSGLM